MFTRVVNYKEFFMKKRFRRTKRAGAVLGAVLLAAMLVGCRVLKTFDGAETPADPGDTPEAPLPFVLYVSGGGNDTEGAGSKGDPFATLAYAYTEALDDPTIQTIYILSNLVETGNSPMTLDATGKAPQEITITSDGGLWMLTRTGAAGDGDDEKGYWGPSVVKITGGAKVVFSNIKITGEENNRALYISGPGNMVTLTNTTLTGKAPMGGGVAIVNIGGGQYSPDNVWIPDPLSTIRMNGSTITGESTSEFGAGGGVYITGVSAEFEMVSGTISGTAFQGGGVYVNQATFTIKGGTVSESRATNGGGVWLGYDAQFTMSGDAAVSGNEAIGSGGGVYADSTGGYFTMSGNSTVSDNRAINGSGGGVYTGTYAQPDMSGSSIIYGSESTANDLKNTASAGAAIFNSSLTEGSKDNTVSADEWSSLLAGLGQPE
jgi:hypothetical protein